MQIRYIKKVHPPVYKVPAPSRNSTDATKEIPTRTLTTTLMDVNQTYYKHDTNAPSVVNELSDTLLRPYGNEDVQMEPIKRCASAPPSTTNPMIEEASEDDSEI
jgi:hypothetical protein